MPTTLKQANAFVGELHRHHDAVVGHRWSVGCRKNDQLVGVEIVGRPVAQKTEQYVIAEVTRLCTDGTKNACSFLYALTARIAKEMGFDHIQTFILLTESGVSLKAAGWTFDGITHSGTHQNRPNRRTDEHGRKQRWIKLLK